MGKIDDVNDGVVQLGGMRYLQIYKSRRDNAGHKTVCDWNGLVERLKNATKTPEKQLDYLSADKDTQARLKDAGGYIAGHVEGSRGNSSIRSRWLVALDIDEADADTLDKIVSALQGLKFAAHTTRSSTPTSPRYRVLVPLLLSIPAAQFVEVSRYVGSLLIAGGVWGVDDASHKPAQLMYFPTVSEDQQYNFWVYDGVELDGEAIVAAQLQKRQYSDPRKKAGYIGAFCTAYNIHEAIETFVSDVYIRRGERRYEYSGSTSGTAGVYVFEGNTGMYSHHDSDELKGKAVNAYDIVLHYKFNGDKARFHDYCATDERVMKAFRYEAKEVVKDEKWLETLKRDEDGKLVKSIDNITKILLNDEDICNGIKYNELNESIDIVGSLPWKVTGKRWGDDDHLCLLGWLERKYGIYSREKLDASLAEYLKQRRFDPLKQYLDECHTAWDKVPRAEKLIVDYLGAEDTDYTRACTRVMLLGAVSRAYEAGCKFDYVVCLLSKQGAGKSTLLNKLGGQWYSDSITTMEGIEAYEALRGVWIVEVAELAAKRRSGRDAVKKFLTSQVDTYRPKYGRNVKQFFRRNIFVATTNDSEMLNDPTGNRRFLPVECINSPMLNVHDMNQDIVQQIWGEAVNWYKSGLRAVLSKEMEGAAEETRKDYTEISLITETVLSFIDKPITANWYRMSLFERQMKLQTPDVSCVVQRDFISAREIWKEALQGEGETPSFDVRREIQTALAHLKASGWTRAVQRLGRDYGEKTVTGLRRPTL